MSHYIAAYPTTDPIAEYHVSSADPDKMEVYEALDAEGASNGDSGAGAYIEFDQEALEQGIKHLSENNGSNEAMQFLIECLKEAKEHGQVLIFFG